MEPNQFLPVSRADMEERGWKQLDFIIISGDAYVDHPSFGHAIIGRTLERAGYKVGIIPQPDWKSTKDFKKLGRPRLGFLVTAGNLDSMVNHYTVSKRRRDKDFYSPGGKTGYRPDRATIVYVNRIKEAYKKIPIIIGGIEASLRRFAHYDYWSDQVRRSMLYDCEADLLIYGMGERQVVEIADLMNSGMDIQYIRHIPGTCYLLDHLEEVYDYHAIPSFETVRQSAVEYAKAFKVQYDEQDPMRGNVLVQKHGDRYLVQNPPVLPLSEAEMDYTYALPYMRNWHPMYDKQGGIPAIREVKFSLVSERGCFGGCSFCALTFHQGRIIQTRSHKSILKEADLLIKDPDFKGYIHDVGGPTANFRHMACEKQKHHGACKDRQCLFPEPCPNLNVSHADYLELLRKLRGLEGVKKVFVRSGIRYDYLMADDQPHFFEEMVEHHVSGQLKVAPEHISENVLEKMGKPCGKTYGKFVDRFYAINKKVGKEQYLVPYLMSSHPGSTLKEAIELAEYLRDLGYMPEQVQDFYPTPGTLSTCMYYTGLDPRTMEPVYVPKSREEKRMQRALLQYRNPRNYDLVYEALIKAGRQDLIGYGTKCLIKPKEKNQGRNQRKGKPYSKDKRKSRKSRTRKKRRA